MRRAAADRRSEERPKGEKRGRAARTTSVHPSGAPRRWSGRTREHRLTGRTGPRRGAVRRPIRAGPRRGRGARGRGRRAAQRQKMHTVGVRLPKLPASIEAGTKSPPTLHEEEARLKGQCREKRRRKEDSSRKERERTAMGERSAMAGAWKEDEDRERTTRGRTPFGIIALLHTSAARP